MGDSAVNDFFARKDKKKTVVKKPGTYVMRDVLVGSCTSTVSHLIVFAFLVGKPRTQ